MTTDADKIDNLLAQWRELMDKIEEQIDERGRIIERIQSAPDTPIARLRARHKRWIDPQPDRATDTCTKCPEPWPCDTIAALDALTVRLQEQVETNMELAGLAGQQQLDAIVLHARLDAATEQAEALVGALERILDEGPICFPEDKERCHCCEGTKEHGHADGCDWMLGQDALRAYKEANNE